MIIKDNRSISSVDSSSSFTASSSSSESEQEHCQYALEGDLLVVRHLLGSLVKEGEKSQRKNIFHTRCLINGHTCSLMIDGGSCTNVASSRLVQKLSLDTTTHLKPYKLQWLSDNGDLVIDKQVLLSF
ncbi:retroviral-like aspartic protease, partial [Salmonella enterica subsp. enterica serovar Typhi]|nr:retroviral-like aspartic protease [Salmonella enterica subsp. enterica serovar Typhi]